MIPNRKYPIFDIYVESRWHHRRRQQLCFAIRTNSIISNPPASYLSTTSTTQFYNCRAQWTWLAWQLHFIGSQCCTHSLGIGCVLTMWCRLVCRYRCVFHVKINGEKTHENRTESSIFNAIRHAGAPLEDGTRLSFSIHNIEIFHGYARLGCAPLRTHAHMHTRIVWYRYTRTASLTVCETAFTYCTERVFGWIAARNKNNNKNLCVQINK